MNDGLCRLDFFILDELGHLPFAQSGGQLLFHLGCPERCQCLDPRDAPCRLPGHHVEHIPLPVNGRNNNNRASVICKSSENLVLC